jgi:hypothetical protein
MKTTARIFDGMADGKCAVSGLVFRIKTDPYGSVEQSSGSDIGSAERVRGPSKKYPDVSSHQVVHPDLTEETEVANSNRQKTPLTVLHD